MTSSHALARRLPDLPRWVELRALLLRDECEVLGLRQSPELRFAARDPETGEIFVVGAPDRDTLRSAVERSQGGATVIAPAEQAPRLAALLPEWAATRAVLHRLGAEPRLPGDPADRVRLLDPARLDRLVPDAELRRELRSGARHSPVAAAFASGEPVSFCYAGAITESLWDVAIDTLPEHRRRGYAALCAAYMIRYLQRDGKHPVWGAVDENPASWRLARKLGFVPVDELVLLQNRRASDPP